MTKGYTTIEQSKKLIELGIDVNTADLWWNYDDTEYPSVDYNIGFHKKHKEDIPAWSLSALLGLMEQWTLNGFANGKFNCRDGRVDKYALVDTCPLDAAFEMTCWLKENGKI